MFNKHFSQRPNVPTSQRPNVPTLFLCLLLSLVAFLSGCKKDLLTSKGLGLENPISKTHKSNISLADVKLYVDSIKELRERAGNIKARTAQNPFEFQLDFNWQNYINESSFTNRDYVVVQIKNDKVAFANNFRLDVYGAFTRDSANQIHGYYYVYHADSVYFKRVNGQVNVRTFTGNLMIFDINSTFIKGVKLLDGSPIGVLKSFSLRTGSVGVRDCGSFPVSVTWDEDCMTANGELTFCIYYTTYNVEYCTEPITWYVPQSDPWGTNNPNNNSNNNTNIGGSSTNSDPSVGFLNDLANLMMNNDAYLRSKWGLSEAQNTALQYLNNAGFSGIELYSLYQNQLLSQAFNFMLANDHSATAKELIALFLQNINGLKASRFSEYVTTNTISPYEKLQRLKTLINIKNDFEAELTQLAQQDVTAITSGGDMNILMRIFTKVLGKKIGRVIPFVGTALDAEAAWTAYNLGNYGEAAFALAGIAIDFLPVGIVLETGWTIAGVAYDAFKAYKPIIALSDFLVTNRVLLDALIETFDDLNLFSNLELLSQWTRNSAQQF